MQSKLKILLSLAILFLLAGCWDTVEIEDRGFIAGIAIDIAEEDGMYEMTEQIIVPAGLGTATNGGSGEGYRNLRRVGESLQNVHSQISRQESSQINIEHLGFIIISEEVAKEEGMLGDVLDVFIRQPGMRRGITLAIANGKAKDFLEVEPEHEKVPAHYLMDLAENHDSALTTAPVRIGDVQEFMMDDRSFIIPKYTILEENIVEYEGLGLFRGSTHQLVGVLKLPEAKAVQFIVGKNQHGTVTTDVDGNKLSIIIIDGSSKKKLNNRDKNNLHFEVTIQLDVAVAEYTGERNLDKKQVVQEFEEIINEEIKKRAEETIKVVKDEYQVDVFSLQDYLRMYHHDVWKQVEGDWDTGKNYFSQSTIDVTVESNLFRPGSSSVIE